MFETSKHQVIVPQGNLAERFVSQRRYLHLQCVLYISRKERGKDRPRSAGAGPMHAVLGAPCVALHSFCSTSLSILR